MATNPSGKKGGNSRRGQRRAAIHRQRPPVMKRGTLMDEDKERKAKRGAVSTQHGLAPAAIKAIKTLMDALR